MAAFVNQEDASLGSLGDEQSAISAIGAIGAAIAEDVDEAAIVAYFTATLGDVDDVSGDVGGEADDALVDQRSAKGAFAFDGEKHADFRNFETLAASVGGQD